MDDRHLIPCIDAVQGDASTRVLELTLLSEDKAWTVPTGTVVSVAYRKGDGTSGWYDALPDGTPACSFSGNVITATLAPQVLTAPGAVQVAVVLCKPDTLEQLAVFPLTVEVTKNPAAGETLSNDYYNYSTMEQINSALGSAKPLWITISGSKSDGYTADKSIDDIQNAEESGQLCVCEWDGVFLPFVRVYDGVAYFSAVLDGDEYRVEISSERVSAYIKERNFVQCLTGLSFEHGTIVPGYGTEHDDTDEWIRTSYFPILDTVLSIHAAEDVVCNVFFYNSSLEYVGYLQMGNVRKVIIPDKYIRSGAVFARLSVRWYGGWSIKNITELGDEVAVSFYPEGARTVGRVTVSGNETDGYSIDDTVVAALKRASNTGQFVVCRLDEAGIYMPLTKASSGAWTFSAVENGEELRVQIDSENNVQVFRVAVGSGGAGITHAWDGTVLTVTSASGTSSADLKGEKGDTGAQGPQGKKGDTGAQGEKGEKGDTGDAWINDVDILLPSSDVAVVGQEYNIYKDAIVFASIPAECYDIVIQLDDTGVQAYNYGEVWRFTPSGVGTYTLSVTVRDAKTGNGGVYATKTMTLYVVEKAELSNKNVLFIGDSLTYAGIYTAEIQHNLSGGGITSIGTVERTRTINGAALTSMCEGRNGWATWDYAGTMEGSKSKFLSDENVFRNPDTDLFDLGYYMDTYHPGVSLNAICLNLGTNGIGAHISVMTGMNELITRIREYSATLPILIHIPIPVAKQDYRAYIAYQKNATSPYIRMRWYDLAKAYIEAYDGTMDNVYLVPVYLNMDVDHDFPTETVAVSARNPATKERVTDGHPNTYGYLKMADVYYAHLLRYMEDDGAVYYSVTNHLTNVSNSNSAAIVKENSSYSAALTADSGYALDAVAVTMGGTAVDVTDGVIRIEAVTGDIVITAAAVAESVAAYTNLADPGTANDSSPNTALTADEWLNGYYISSRAITAKADLIVTNVIPLAFTDTIRVKGFEVTGTINGTSCAGRFRILPCDSGGNALLSEIQPAMSTETIGVGRLECMDAAELANGIYCFSPQNDVSASYWANVAYVRICGYPIDGDNDNVIVTVNESIV